MMIIPALALLFFSDATAFQPSSSTALASARWTGNSGVLSAASNGSDESSRRDFFYDVARVSAMATVGGGLTTTLSVAAVDTAIATTAPSQAALVLPPMGLGAWAWGDSLFWGCKNNEEVIR